MAAGAQPGNQFGLALKDPETRQKAYKSFCDHLAAGKSLKSWYYDKENHLCSWQTMTSYIENNPHEFSSLHKDIAFAKGYQHWEGIADASAKGDNKNANTASLQMVMRNKYGWDKHDNKGQESQNQQSIDLQLELARLITERDQAKEENAKLKASHQHNRSDQENLDLGRGSP